MLNLAAVSQAVSGDETLTFFVFISAHLANRKPNVSPSDLVPIDNKGKVFSSHRRIENIKIKKTIKL